MSRYGKKEESEEWEPTKLVKSKGIGFLTRNETPPISKRFGLNGSSLFGFPQPVTGPSVHANSIGAIASGMLTFFRRRPETKKSFLVVEYAERRAHMQMATP